MYTIAPTRDPAQTTLRYVEHAGTERVDDGYRVHFFVEPADEPSTADSTSASPTPAASGTYSVAHYIDDRPIRRQTRVGPTPYTGLRPEENGTLVAC